MSSNLHELINAQDEAINTILRLSELGPALDDGGVIYFPHCIEVLALIRQQAGHLDKLSSQLAQHVLPHPRAVEGSQP